MRRTAEQDERSDRRIALLERELSRLRHQVEGLGRFTPNMPHFSNVRMGRTTKASGATYPVPDASSYNPNTYSVAFDDGSFSKTPGRNYPTFASHDSLVTAIDVCGGYVWEGFPVAVAKSNDQWWIIAGSATWMRGTITVSGFRVFPPLVAGSPPPNYFFMNPAWDVGLGTPAPTNGKRAHIHWEGPNTYLIAGTGSLAGGWYYDWIEP